MARKINSHPATQLSMIALESKFDTLADRMDKRMDSGFAELKGIIVRFAADVDRRFAKTATLEMLSDVKTTVDGHTGVLDHIVGELHDLRESRLVFSAMYKDHGTRLTALESRKSPPTP